MKSIERKKILITVTTYPLPSRKYQELVCTAGLTEEGDWVRIYPVPLSALVENRFRKYHWIELDLEKRIGGKDFRPESYKPHRDDLSDMVVGTRIDTADDWAERKKYCMKRVEPSLSALLEKAKNRKVATSLAVYKPAQLLEFMIEETERDWKDAWKNTRQMSLFEEFKRLGIRKVPYKFSYRFLDDAGQERNLMIEDWEIGQLYWNCLKNANGNEALACQKVKEKYWDDLALTKDLYLFLGTTLRFHAINAPNPFVIIGVFYPPKPAINPQLQLF
jgi:hypothetical protein